MMNNVDSVLFEIPKGELDKDFVWNVAIKKTTIGAGFGGQNVSSHVVRWTKRGDRILLQGVDYSITADPTTRSPVRWPMRTIRRSSARCRSRPTRPNGDAVVDVDRPRHGQRQGGPPEFAARGASVAAGGDGRPTARSSNAPSRFPRTSTSKRR